MPASRKTSSKTRTGADHQASRAGAPRKKKAKKSKQAGARKKTAAAHADAGQQNEDSFEARARSAPLIYRFFNAADSCGGYLAGRWEGRGLQGVPVWPVDVAMQAVLECGASSGGRANSVRFVLRAIVSRGGLFARLMRGMRGLFSGNASANGASPSPADRESPARSRSEYSSDPYAQDGSADRIRRSSVVPQESAAGYRREIVFDLENEIQCETKIKIEGETDSLPLSDKDQTTQNAFGPDYARLRRGDWELTVQVLENVRAHAQLRRLDGLASIYFSGVLRKTR
ncbi:MAG: hypothetical protein NXI24_19620 [bacterium]|nr:hypothetical protein [bacterium]